MTSPEHHRESQDPSPTKPYQAKLTTSSSHPIHPTKRSSTPAQNTVDGSTRTCDRLTTRDAVAMLDQLNADREQSTYWRDKWATSQGDQHIEAWLESLFDWLPATRQSTTEATDQLRPVVNSVARTEADIAAVALDDMAMPLGPGGWESCVADLIRTAPGVLARLAAAERERDRLCDQVAELEALRRADITVIGHLGVAVPRAEGERDAALARVAAARRALLQGGQLAEIRCRAALVALDEGRG